MSVTFISSVLALIYGGSNSDEDAGNRKSANTRFLVDICLSSSREGTVSG